MARAHSIWLVFAGNAALPMAAFTVKHEMVTFLKENFDDPASLNVYKYPDGYARPTPAYPRRQVVHEDAAELMS